MENEILFQGKTRNYYHTKKEHSIVPNGQILNGMATITGFTKEPIDVGTTLNISQEKYKVVELVEKRNHAGTFDNPDDKLDSFFKVEASFERVIVSTN